MIEFHTLGTADLRRREEESFHSFLSGSKRLALLAYLVLQRPRGFQRRDRLLALLWPESDQKRARGSLRYMLHQIRRTLGQDVVVSRGDEEIGIADGALWCDAIAFEQTLEAKHLREALELYRGDLLEGFFAPDTSPSFDQWLEEERSRLRRRAVEAAWALAEEEEEAGNTAGAAYWAGRMARMEPFDEAATRRLMELLDRTGNRAAALRAYGDFAERLRAEMDLSPSAATQELAEHLRSRTAEPQAEVRGEPADHSRTRAVISARAAEPGSVAVLAFENLGANPGDEYLGDGIAEEIIIRLSQVKDFRVTARTSSFVFKEKPTDVREIARTLGVAHVLEGSIRAVGDRIRITAQLIGAETGYHLWSEAYDRDRVDLFGVQDDISRRIVDALRRQIPAGGDSLAQEHAPDPEAHDLYLRGRFFSAQGSREGLEKGRDYFRRALERDSAYAQAWAALAEAEMVMADAYLPPHEVNPGVKEAARRALELDETLALAHAVLAHAHIAYDWDWPAARQELDRALELSPSLAFTHFVETFYWWAMGEYEEGLASMKRSVRLDPLSPVANHFLVLAFIIAGDLEAALESQRKLEEIAPGFVYVDSFLGDACREQGRYEEAIRAYREAERVLGHPSPGLAVTYARMGQVAEAESILRTLEDSYDEQHVPPELIASVHAALGDLDRALEWLEKGLEARSALAVAHGTLPELQRLYSDPRFQALREQMHLPLRLRSSRQ